MSLNIRRGINRLILVISILWLLFFLLVAFANISSPRTNATIAFIPCNELEKDEPSSSSYLASSNWKVGKKRMERLKNEGRLVRSYTVDERCDGIIKVSFLKRINNHVITYLIVSLLSIPFYLTLIFILNGFYKKD